MRPQEVRQANKVVDAQSLGKQPRCSTPHYPYTYSCGVAATSFARNVPVVQHGKVNSGNESNSLGYQQLLDTLHKFKLDQGREIELCSGFERTRQDAYLHPASRQPCLARSDEINFKF